MQANQGKRKRKDTEESTDNDAGTAATNDGAGPSVKRAKPSKAPPQPRSRRLKLAPPRPFPSVPTSSNATGPRSARAEGNNQILVSRKTPLGAYLRRCKECVLKHGYKTVNLSAMAAAIPHLLLLVTSLPETLPYSREEVHFEYKTGTVKSMDEVLPAEDEEDEDTIQSDLVERKSSSLSVTITIGDGSKEITGKEKGARRAKRQKKQPVADAEDAMSTDDE